MGGDIVWLHGPFPCSDWPDIVIFRDSLIRFLDQGERVEADDGYMGEAPMYIKCPKKDFVQSHDQKKIKQKIRCRQETINKRFKHFEVLKTTFRHDISLHADIFRAVAVLVQLQIEEGEKLFDVDQYDDTNFE